MGRGKWILKNANQFFDEMELSDKLKQLSDMFADKTMIRGEVTEELREALRRAPDPLIDMIWEEIVDRQATGKADRQRKEEILYEDIQEYLKAELVFMDPMKLKLLISIMNNYPINLEETLVIMEDLAPYGWVFTFLEEDSCAFVVMKELRDILMTIEEPDVKSRMEVAFTARCLVNVCLGLYGACRLEQIEDVFKSVLEEGSADGESGRNAIEAVLKVIPVLEAQNVLWRDNGFFISPLLNKKDYRKLVRNRREQYYIPDNEIISSYALGKLPVKSPEYEAVLALLSREIKDCAQAEEMLEEIYGCIVREDWELSEVMNCLYERNVVFKSTRTVERMALALSDWIYGIRRWCECGHSRKELNREDRNQRLVEKMNQKEAPKDAVKKIYPNDPCPCGSGRKYKKCCGSLIKENCKG